MTITKEQALMAKPPLVEYEVPEWGGTVWIRPVTLQEQGTLAVTGKKYDKADELVKLKNQTLPLIIWTVCDQDGNPLFSNENIPELLNQPSYIFFRLQAEILKASGLSEESRAEIAKNSESVQVNS